MCKYLLDDAGLTRSFEEVATEEEEEEEEEKEEEEEEGGKEV